MNRTRQIKIILSERIDVTNLNENTELKSLGFNYSDLLNLAIEIEDKIGVTLDIDEIDSFKTIRDVIDCVNSK